MCVYMYLCVRVSVFVYILIIMMFEWKSLEKWALSHRQWLLTGLRKQMDLYL